MTYITSLARILKPTLLFIFTTLTATHILASEQACCCWLDAYAGIDAQLRHMPFQKHFGGNVLKHRYPQGNVFAGVKFNEYVGVEAGYEFSKKQRSTKTHPVGDVVFGQPITPAEISPFSITNTSKSRASSKIRGFNLNLVGYLPILCIEYNTQLIGSIGLAALKSRSRNTLTRTEVDQIFFDPITGDPIDGTETNITSTTTSFKKHKTVFKFSAGIQKMLTPCIGVRALVSRENSSKIKARGSRNTSIAKLKHSSIYGVGVFTAF